MTLPRLWAALVVVLPALASILAPTSTVDLAYQLRAGDEILRTATIPAVDAWTYTVSGQPWWDQQWGAQAVLAMVSGLAGWTGLALLRAALTALAVVATFAAVRDRGAATRQSAVVALLAFLVASPSLALRPQLFGVALFATTLWALGRRRAGRRGPWLVPVLAIAWANVHGSFVLAPLAVGWALLDDVAERSPRTRRTAPVLVATLAATAVTPWGPDVWRYAVGFATNGVVAARVTEWQPPSITDPAGLAFLGSGIAALVILAAAWRRGRRMSWASLAWLAGLFALGLRAVRGLAWWPIGAAVALAPVLASPSVMPAAEPARSSPALRRLNAVVVGALLLVGVALLPAWRPLDAAGMPQGVLRDAPAGVTEALRREAVDGDRVFHPQRWGSWFEYAVPAVRTFVDSRIEIFPDAVWADYDALASGAPGWQARLASLGIRLVVTAPEDDDLARRLRDAGWMQAYAGSDGSVFVRVPASPLGS